MKERLGWHFPDHDEFFYGRTKAFPLVKYQQVIFDEAIKLVPDFKCAIDIGANIGLHTIRLAQQFETVHAFEPIFTNFECLVKNTESYSNITYYQSALGNSSGNIEMRAPEDMHHCGAFSIDRYAGGGEKCIIEQVKINFLDNYNLSPNLIKIDVEGHESTVLEGAAETIKKHKPILILEHTAKTFAKIKPILEFLNYCCVFSHQKDKIWIFNENSTNRS